jgi:hypothetical protein
MESNHSFLHEEIASLLKQLEKSELPDSDLWSEIWDTVHHQGDVSISSYIAVPEIFKVYKEKKWFDASLPAFLAVIENCRQKEKNPKLPDWLKDKYFQTLEETVKYCAENISKQWDREILLYFLLLVCAVKQNQGIYELLNIASASKYDENFLLEFYYKS